MSDRAGVLQLSQSQSAQKRQQQGSLASSASSQWLVRQLRCNANKFTMDDDATERGKTVVVGVAVRGSGIRAHRLGALRLCRGARMRHVVAGCSPCAAGHKGTRLCGGLARGVLLGMMVVVMIALLVHRDRPIRASR